MTTLFEELDKILKEKNLTITCNDLEINRLKKENEEMRKAFEAILAENEALKNDVRMYQENEVSRHE